MFGLTIASSQCLLRLVLSGLDEEVDTFCGVLTNAAICGVVCPLVIGDSVAFQYVLTLRQTIDRLLEVAVADGPGRTIALPSFDELADCHVAIGVACALIANVVSLLAADIVGCPSADVARVEGGIDEHLVCDVKGIFLAGTAEVILSLCDGNLEVGDGLLHFCLRGGGVLIDLQGSVDVNASIFSFDEGVVEGLLGREGIQSYQIVIGGDELPVDVGIVLTLFKVEEHDGGTHFYSILVISNLAVCAEPSGILHFGIWISGVTGSSLDAIVVAFLRDAPDVTLVL